MPDETPKPTEETPKPDAIATEEPPKASDTNPDTGKRYTQDEFEAEVKRRLASQKAAIESQQAKERKQQEDAALAQQGEYQKLAEERQQRITELERQVAEAENVTSQRDRYKGTLSTFLTKEREGLPAHILALLDRMDEADQLEYITTNRDALKPATSTNGVHVPETPKPADTGALTDAERERRRRIVAGQVRAAL